MKSMKQIVCTILTLCLCVGLFMIPSTPVSAATTPSVSKNVDVYYYPSYPDVNDYAISVNLGTYGKNIKNIKTNSKNLKAKLTSLNLNATQTLAISVSMQRKPVITKLLLMYTMPKTKK